mmetsp:Transcript_39011/g.65028  ORF Transcript_39011/g.65028 Transcript_39011/m.65028 type:complete len:309 (+) Transcript_39011:157-1083(+)
MHPPPILPTHPISMPSQNFVPLIPSMQTLSHSLSYPQRNTPSSPLLPGSVHTEASPLSPSLSTCVDAGYSKFWSTYPRLARLLRGIKNSSLADLSTKPTRLPIDNSVFSLIFQHPLFNPLTFSGLLLRAVCTTAFCGFFRIGELTSLSPSSFNSIRHISYRCLSFHTNPYTQQPYAQLFLPTSKTDQAGKGHYFIFEKVANELYSPFFYLQQLHSSHPTKLATAPLFCDSTGSPLIHANFLRSLDRALVDVGFPAKFFHGHSFRIGAYNRSLDLGVPLHIVESLGRWKSLAHLRYFRPLGSTQLDIYM